MKRDPVKKLVLNSLMIALVFLATYFTRIPTPLPGGYFNLGDSVIMLAAVFLGPIGGIAAGAAGSCLADLAAGAFLFAPVTFVVKGVEGLAVGLLAAGYRKAQGRARTVGSGKVISLRNSAQSRLALLLAVVVGAAVMVAGYFLAEAFLLGAFDKAFGLTAAVTELLPNGIQGLLSAALGYILILLLAKADIGL